MIKSGILTVFLVLSTVFCLFPDKVTLIRHDNTEITGNLGVSEDPNVISLDSGDFRKSDIKRIRFEKEASEKPEKVLIEKSPYTREEMIKRAENMKKRFPDAGYITLCDHAVNEYIDPKNSTSVYHGAYVILKDDFKHLARIGAWVDESKMSYRVIFGRIIYPDGTEFNMNPSDLVKSVPKDKGAAFFSSRGSVLYYNFPKASAGCIVEYKYEYKHFLPTIDDLFESKFVFNSDQPVETSVLEVIMPEGKKLFWAPRNMSDKESSPVIETKNGKTTYSWNFGIQDPVIAEPMMPDLGDICKVIYYSNQESMEFIFKWHRDVLAKNMVVTPLIKQTVDEILKDVKDDPVEIVRHLYHYMQREIRYVSIKSGTMSGLAGHFAEETLKNRFGDCVDKAVLFSTMMKSRNIESYPLIINTNPHEEMESRIATINGNHSITLVVLNGKRMILDTTSTNHSFPYFRWDDHGVPVYNSIKGEIFRADVPPPEDNLSKYTRTVNVDQDGRFTVSFKGEYNGNRAAGLRGYYKTVSDKDLKKVFEGMVKTTAPDAELIDYAVNNKDDLFKDISIVYSYSSKEFLKKAGNLFIMKNICPLPYTFSELSLNTRKYDIEYGTTERRTHENTFNFPSNYRFEYLPEPFEIQNDYVYYKAEYTAKGQTLVFKEIYDLKKRIVKQQDYLLYKADILKILDYQKKNVILSRTAPKNYADLLILKSGDEIDGELLEIKGGTIRFETKTGELRNYGFTDILSIEMAKTGGKSINMMLDDILDDELRTALEEKASANEYPGSHKVILLDKHHYKYNGDGTYTYTFRIITRILSEKGKNAGFDNWNVDPLIEKFNIDHAYTINGKEVTSLSSRTIKTALAFSAYPEYQRLNNTKFAMPNILVDSVIDYQISRTVKIDKLLHPFAVGISRGSSDDSATLDAGHNSSWNSPPCGFYSVEPMVRKELSFEVPKGFIRSGSVVNNQDGTIVEKVIPGKETVTYKYVNALPMNARIKEYRQPPINEFWPMVLFAEASSRKTLFKELEKLFKVQAEDLSKASELIRKLGANPGKPGMEEIYDFVVRDIASVPVGIKDYDFKPKSIGEILKNRKAAQLDHAWLLYVLLKAANFDAELCLTPATWFSRNVIEGYDNLSYFSNLLVRVKKGSSIHYISALDSLLSMADSAMRYEGFQVLRLGEKEISVEEIPLSANNSTVLKLKGKLDNTGNMKDISINLVSSGLSARSLRNLRMINQEKWPVIAANVVNTYHSNSILKDFRFNGIKELTRPPSADFSFDIPSYCTNAGDLYFMKFIGTDHPVPPEAAPQKRTQSDIDLGTAVTAKKQYEIEIPSEFAIFYLPEKIHVEDCGMKYVCVAEQKGNLLIFNEEFSIINPVIAKEKYRDYQKFRKVMADFSEEYVIFKKK